MSDLTKEITLKTTAYQDVQPCTTYENMDLTKWDKIFACIRRDANAKRWGTYDEPIPGHIVTRTKLKSWRNRADITCDWKPKIKYKSKRIIHRSRYFTPVDEVK